MRTLLLSCCLVVTSVAVAQLNTCLNTMPQIRNIARVPMTQANLPQGSRLATRSPYEPAVGISEYVIDGQSRTAPSVEVQYVPQNKTSSKLIFSGGFLWSSRSNGLAVDPRVTRVQSNTVYLPVGSSDYYVPSVGMGYVGAQYRYYFLQGDIQPYVGAGAQFLGWRVDSRWGAALAPNAVAGLTAHISDIFSGFAEIQHTIGVGNLLAYSSSFGGITSVSIGFAFAPSFGR